MSPHSVIENSNTLYIADNIPRTIQKLALYQGKRPQGSSDFWRRQVTRLVTKHTRHPQLNHIAIKLSHHFQDVSWSFSCPQCRLENFKWTNLDFAQCLAYAKMETVCATVKIELEGPWQAHNGDSTLEAAGKARGWSNRTTSKQLGARTS